MDWKDVVTRWRALPEEEKAQRWCDSIPRSVAASMAFAGQPVDLAWLELECRRLAAERSTPPSRPKRIP